MNAHIQSEVEAEFEQANTLKGGRILHAAISSSKESLGLVIQLPNGKIVIAWVDCDPEGNGAGHLAIEPRQ